MEEYQTATFVGGDGLIYGLADEVRAHLVEGLLAEQREYEKQTGKRAPAPPRKRPAFKKRQE